MKSWKLALTTLVLVTSTCLPKAQAISLSKTEVNQVSSTQIALNDTYWGPDKDFSIQMPGSVQENQYRKLTSWSDTSETAYVFLYRDMPVQAAYLSAEEIRDILQTSMRGEITSTGKIVKSTNLEIDEYPGLELLVQHANGTTGQYRGFIVKGRMYMMASVTQGELTTESVHFFDSFGVYPERVR